MHSIRRLASRLPLKSAVFAREISGTLVANILIAAISLVSGVLLARLLGPEGRGQLAALQALPLMIAGIGQLGLPDAVIYYGSREPDRVGAYSISAFLLTAAASVPILLLSAAVLPIFLREQSPEIITASQVYLLMLLAYAAQGVPIFTVRALHQIALWNKMRLLAPVLWPAIIITAYFFGADDPISLAMGNLVASFVTAAALLFFVRHHFGRAGRPWTLWPRLLRFGLPTAAATTPQILSGRMDQLFIAGILPDMELGLYAVAISFSGLAMLPATAIQAVAFSRIAQIHDRPRQCGLIRRATVLVGAVSIVPTIGVALLAPVAINWVFGPGYAPAADVARILSLSVLLRALARILQVGMQAIGRPTGVMYSEWWGFAVLAPGIFLLLPEFGLRGAAWSVVASAAAVLISVSFLFARESRSIQHSLQQG